MLANTEFATEMSVTSLLLENKEKLRDGTSSVNVSVGKRKRNECVKEDVIDPMFVQIAYNFRKAQVLHIFEIVVHRDFLSDLCSDLDKISHHSEQLALVQNIVRLMKHFDSVIQECDDLLSCEKFRDLQEVMQGKLVQILSEIKLNRFKLECYRNMVYQSSN